LTNKNENVSLENQRRNPYINVACNHCALFLIPPFELEGAATD